MIDLPRKTEEGKPRISYSQINSWKELTAFNPIKDESGNFKNLSGKSGYILQYFFDYQFPEHSMEIYGRWGQRIEDAICFQKYEGFDAEEIKILQEIKPLGVFQQEVDIDFGEFNLTGFKDDTNESQTILRDYKGCSKASSQRYRKDSYIQLDVYALDLFRREGVLPERLEVCLIYRDGSHIKPPIKVSGWEIIEKKTSEARLWQVESEIISITTEISDAYKVFKEINNIK